MRLLEVVVRFHPYTGGVENAAYELCRRLVRRGHQVRVVCAAEPTGPSAVEGISVLRLPYLGKLANTNLALGLPRALAREAADVFHTHQPTAWFLDRAARAARLTQRPLVVTYHNDLAGAGLKGLVATLYNRLFLPRVLLGADRVVVDQEAYLRSSPWISRWREQLGKRLMVIPLGVDLDRFRPTSLPPGPPWRLGFLSLLDRQHDYKGLAPLLEGLAALRAREPELDLRLSVGGAGSELAAWRQRTIALGIGDRVDFRGFVPDSELAGFYASCHLFALPSTDSREGFGLVLLEALACGRGGLTTPIVAAAADLAAEAAGFVVPPNDVGALTRALHMAFGGPEAAVRLAAMGSRAGALAAGRYGWEIVVDRYEDLFRSLATAGTGSSST